MNTKVDFLSITLDRKNSIFLSGELITGSVNFKIKERLKINSLKLYIAGFANCSWLDTNGKIAKRKDEQQAFLSFFINFIKSEANGSEVFLNSGEYSYSFEIKLPEKLPTSYKDSIGQIEYSLKASLDVAWSLNKNFTLPFTVLNPVDLNKMASKITDPASKLESKVFCCGPCKSLPLSATLKLEKTCFVPGENIQFTVEINNTSSRNINLLEVALVRSTKHTIDEKNRTERKVLAKVENKEGVAPNASFMWTNGVLKVPLVHPSSFESVCNIIEVDYLVQLKVKSSLLSKNLIVPKYIVIGYIQRKQNAEQKNRVFFVI